MLVQSFSIQHKTWEQSIMGIWSSCFSGAHRIHWCICSSGTVLCRCPQGKQPGYDHAT